MVCLGESRIHTQGWVWGHKKIINESLISLLSILKKYGKVLGSNIDYITLNRHETVFFMAFVDKQPELLEEPSEVKETLVRFIF